MFEKVASLIAAQLRIDPSVIKPESRLLEDLKADSASVMMMIMDMENEFGIVVEDEALMSIKTVGDVVNYLNGKC